MGQVAGEDKTRNVGAQAHVEELGVARTDRSQWSCSRGSLPNSPELRGSLTYLNREINEWNKQAAQSPRERSPADRESCLVRSHPGA